MILPNALIVFTFETVFFARGLYLAVAASTGAGQKAKLLRVSLNKSCCGVCFWTSLGNWPHPGLEVSDSNGEAELGFSPLSGDVRRISPAIHGEVIEV